MKRYIVSIGRQLGSGGKEIGEKLAKKLGISFYDKKLLEEAAKESGLDTATFEGADEKESDSFFSNIVALRHSVTSYFVGNENCMDSDKLFQIQSETIRNIADRESCIIIGRCSEYVLREHPNLISVFITADKEERIARIAMKEKVDSEKAKEMIERGDKERKSYHDYYSTTEWGMAHNYDLCINSSLLGIDNTVEFLFEYITHRLQ